MTVNNRPYQVCARCVMDTSASDIVFDEHGICNYCTGFNERIREPSFDNPGLKKETMGRLIEEIKRSGRGKRYDCVIGVSGGVDSSWVLVNAVRLGLRPLAVHMDNGWNSELAQNNIANLVRGLGLDLYTHVIDWHEYRGLMQGFLDADVLDIELLYDNAMLAVNYRQAHKYGLQYILAGDNIATEGMRMPPGWNWLKFDKKNIKALGRRNNIRRLSTFPAVGTMGFFYYEYVRRIKWVHFLDLLEYSKSDALAELEQDFGYKRYSYKHYESVFTRFYQGYILPRKFKVDKRRLHLSALIITGQLTRNDAVAQLAQIPYPSEREEQEDIHYFLKKMGWNAKQLQDYLLRPERKHTEYPSEKRLWDFAKKMHKLITRTRANNGSK